MTRHAAPLELSVVIPAHNAAETIEAQLDAVAVAMRAAPPTEIVIVDNLSTDDTASRARAWADGTEFDLRVVPADAKPSISYTRNVGVAAARTDRICFCDSDDVVDPNWLAAMAGALDDHPYVTGPLDLDGLNEPWIADVRGRSTSDAAAYLWDVVPYAHGCNMAFRREALEAIHGFDETYLAACDLDVAIRLWEAGHELHFQPDAVVAYRLRDTLRATYRQGVSYGRWRVPIRHRLAKPLDLPSPLPAFLRRVVWLVRRAAPSLFSKRERARWVWTASQLWGEIRGNVEFR